MKNMFSKVIAAILLFSVMAFTACQDNTAEDMPYSDEPHFSLYFDALGGKDVMPIAVFYSPFTPSYIKNGNALPDYTDEYYIKLFADAGINMFSAAPETYPLAKSSIEKVLALAEKYNIGYYVKDYNIGEMFIGAMEVDEEKIAEAIDQFSQYKSFIGFYGYDEPLYEAIDYIGRTNAAIEKVGEGKYTSYVNFLPNYNGLKYTRGSQDISYEQYIEKFFKEGNGKYFCFDHYVFEANDYKLYFKNLDIVKKLSDRYKIPFWSFIQAGGQFNDLMTEMPSKDYYPSEGRFIWNVNTTIAYGAKGIQYFMGIQPVYFAYAPNGTYDFKRNGLIGADGSINEWYYYAQKVNKQLLACDEVLMNALNRGVIPSGGGAAEDLRDLSLVINSGRFHELTGVEGDALIGCFEYNNKTVLYVVNYSFDSTNDIILKFDSARSLSITQRAATTEVAAKNVMIHLEAGEGVMIMVNS